MLRHFRPLLVSLSAAGVLALLVGSVSANNLSLVASRTIRTVWTNLEFGNSLEESIVRCAVTLEGSFHSTTLRKVIDALIGLLSRAAVNACTGGTVTFGQETLPWHIRYRGFRGRLPSVTGADFAFVGEQATIRFPVTTCSTKTTQTHSETGIERIGAGGRLEGLSEERSSQIEMTGGFPCQLGNAFLQGTGTVTQLGNSAALSILLI